MQMSLVRLSTEAAEGLLEAPDSLEDYRPWNVPDGLNLDKAWAGLDFLLAKIEGTEASFLFAVGTPVGDPEEFDFGPPRLLLPKEVADADHLLQGISVQRLREAYDPVELTAKRVYPDVIWNREGEAAYDFLAKGYEGLKTVVSVASAAGDALLIELS